MPDEPTHHPCGRQRLDEHGKFFYCDGYLEVRVPFYFTRQTDGSLRFSMAGDGDGGEGITMNCGECGAAAPRIFYAGIAQFVHDQEDRLGAILAGD